MTKVESTGANKVKIEITVSPEDFLSALQQGIQQEKKDSSVFRGLEKEKPRGVL